MGEPVEREIVRWPIPTDDGQYVTVIFPSNLANRDIEVLALVLRAYIARRDSPPSAVLDAPACG